VGRRQERVVVVPSPARAARARAIGQMACAGRLRCSIVGVSGVRGPARADAVRVWCGSTPGFGPLATCV